MRKSRSITLYLAIAFGFAWAFWLVAWLITMKFISLPLLPMLFIGSFGPLVGAAATTFHDGGLRRMVDFFARALDPRMGWSVFLVAFFLMPILAIIVELLHARFAGQAPQFTMTLAGFPLSYLFQFVLGGTLAEEYGWALLSDRLDAVAVLPLRASTAILGSIWALWHLPLFFIVTRGAIQGYTPFHIFFVVTVAMRFLFAWAYHHGGRSILSNMLFHTAANIAYSVAAIAPAPADLSTGRLWMFTLLTVASAIVLWHVAPPRAESDAADPGCCPSTDR